MPHTGDNKLSRARMWRRALRAAAWCTAVVVMLTAFTASAHADTQFRVIGKGWGHGIGMSQYGAKSLADRGWSGVNIIKYYYTGTTVGSTTARTVRISLRDSMTIASFSATTAGAVVVRGGVTKTLAIGDRVNVKVSGGGSIVERVRGGTTTRMFNGSTSQVVLGGPPRSVRTLFTADNGTYGRHYRGTLSVVYSGGRLRVVNNVWLDQYLLSVVPSEVPTSWPAASLQAQAIAARSYAIATKRAGSFDHYSDTRSQMYRGMEEEEVPTNNAVAATKNLVGKYNGAVIAAFFHSTSGGRTANIEHVWNTSPSPYLKSKADPYEVSPYSNWGPLVYTPAGFKSRLGIYAPGTPTATAYSTWSSGRVRNVVVSGTGGSRTLSGTTFQSQFGLRSSLFRIERLVMTTPSNPQNPGDYARLSGSVPRAGATYLYMRNTGSATWTKVRTITPTSTGTFSVVVRVDRSRDYRLIRSAAWGPLVSFRF